MFKICLITAVLALFTTGLARTAVADDTSLTRTAVADEPVLSVTTSPLLLFVPLAELTAELRLARHVGVAAILGIGTFHDKDTNDRISLYEGGASLRYYVTGSFRTGLQLGAEAIYIHAATVDNTIDVQAAGLAVSPFAGYKWTHRTGVTLEGQLGASFMVARAKADTGTMAERKAVFPMLNLQLGYSF